MELVKVPGGYKTRRYIEGQRLEEETERLRHYRLYYRTAYPHNSFVRMPATRGAAP